MTCNGGCYNKMMDQLKTPVDQNSLAAQRLYDSQTAVSRCIAADNGCESCAGGTVSQEGPTGSPYFTRSQNLSRFEEGFNCNFDMKTILKWLIIGLIVYLILSMITDAQRKPIILPIAVMEQAGGALSEVDILGGLFD